MERSIFEKLYKWKQKKNRKPLILKGARQVGKTWIMKEFGTRAFSSVAYINLDSNPGMKRVFDGDFSITRILTALNAETGVKIVPNETLIIFDEVQEVPRVLSSLKYFCEEAPEYPIIAAGSLLGAALHKGVSFPVGKVDVMTMYPMTYQEFLTAMGEESLSNFLLDCDFEMIRVFHDRYEEYLRQYFFTGGMPEAVNSFAESRDYGEVREIQDAILTLYEDDFGKHIEGTELERVRMLWNSIPLQLAKENKKFFFGQVKKGARSADYETAIQWLIDCGLLHKVYRVSKPGMPLKSYQEQTVFKLYQNDVGLLAAQSRLPAKVLLDGSRVYEEFKGSLTEQYVFQQLRSDTEYEPFYFSPNDHTEIDFVFQKEDGIIPMEVKASTNLRSQSLKAFYEKFRPNQAIRISMAEYKEQEWLVNYPLWAVCVV